MGSLGIEFAGSSLVVEHRGSEAQRVCDFLYRHIAARVPPGSAPVFRLESMPNGDLRATRDGMLICQTADRGLAAERLQGDVCESLASRSVGGLSFHAALLGKGAACVMFPGTMGQGKTTLAAGLLRQGWTYLTDEFVFVPNQVLVCQAFTRPLNVRAAALPLFADLRSASADGRWLQLSHPSGCLLQPEAFGDCKLRSEGRLAMLVFARYSSSADGGIFSMSGAQAGLCLMQHLVNGRNLPGHGFDEVARIARTTPAYQVEYRDFHSLGDRLAALIA